MRFILLRTTWWHTVWVEHLTTFFFFFFSKTPPQNTSFQVDLELLLQRLLATVPSSQDLEDLFTYELCSYPPALFDTNALPRPANKSLLADQLWELAKNVNSLQPPKLSSCILDGGARPQKVPWLWGKTYDELCAVYVTYVERRYGKNVTIVFDGYETLSTKDVTHMHRSKLPEPTVNLEQDMTCKMKKRLSSQMKQTRNHS